MNSLRARVVITLVASIICVVVMATATLFLARQGHIQKEQGDYARLVSEAILLIAPLFGNDENDRLSHLGSGPVPGQPRPELTNLLQSQLRSAGSDLEVVVTQPTATAHPFVSIKLKSGWLALPVPERRRPEFLFALAGWFLLVALGTVCVALWFAHRITRHLAVLERVAATIDADGVVPRLPESGPAELRATARALNTMTARLKNAAESRMRLVAAAGHDLRTPMTRMRLRAEFLDDEEDRAMWLDDLQELDRIADSAIQLVREETQRERSQLLRVDQVIAEICRDLASMKASVTIMKMEAVTISSAPLALTRAVRNLVINAATHGGGAFVTVGLENNSTALITIDDEGPGIPEQSMSRVFEPFFRVDPGRRKSGPGAGLGLAIAKEIVERHGGRLTLQNRSPKGLRQKIIFPACFAQ
ncbi:ATP-binding protein [Bradyrhizobium sp. AZCC 2289]|uniref:ATP-binding protein n=1 Tax=Bradyrhizobium sp. AZCC 2289 TaxID=3117026 RepID=UPI002FF23D39